MTAREPQTADAVLMIRPAQFAANTETVASNFFQRTTAGGSVIAEQARREFDALALTLARAGVRVHQFAGQPDRAVPDEVFPNNWLSLHADGTAVLYPMLAANRRLERRPELLTALRDDYGYRVDRIVDLTNLEAHGEFLEGTGSLVLDRGRRIAYACRSPRTTSAAIAEFCEQLRYQATEFSAMDRAGRAIYHTNVLLAVGTRFAACCVAAIANDTERQTVVAQLESTGHELISLTFDELEGFAGNLLELRGSAGPVIALSATALAALSPISRRALERHGALVSADVATIEKAGGGSVRCMLAEIALPRAG
jgi:hypothetical protein